MAHPMVFCEICNIGVSSEVTMRDHVKGRRHQQALGAMERRKAQARNSLYCHGFPSSTPSSDLRNYFQRFGVVTRIMVETQRGCYCIVQYDSEAPVQKALGQRNHLLSNCSLTVRPRKPITTYRRPAETDRNQRKAKSAKEEEEQMEASHEQLMNSLLQADSVLSQMEVLYEAMRLSDADLERRKRVCDYLSSVLQPFLPTCTIHQFGSSVNGFGMRGCDMDIFLDLHDTEVSLQREETLRQKMKPVNLPYIREIQSLKTTEGPLMPSQLRQLSLVHRVKLLSRILMQHAPQCAEVLFVPSMRCPIVRFVHSPTGIKCDLSINNRLALRNTQLLKMCGTDRRVRLLVFTVRYWGKWKQVAGNQNCGPRLSNYCLSLLVMFFVTNTSPPLLPSVQALADMTGPEQKCIIEEWDCSLPDAVPETSNTQPADELLHQFFQFYHELSLSSSVIRTRTGTVMPLSDFLLEKINSPQLNDFKVKALAVQDPFVLHHNIAQNINNQVRDLLMLEFENAFNKTVTWAPADTTLTDARSSQLLWGLPYLFSTQGCKSPSEVSADPATTSSPSSSSSWCEMVTRDSKISPQWTCSLALDLSMVSQDILTALRAKGDFRAVWFRRVRTLLVWALRELFLFTVKTHKDGPVLTDKDLDGDDSEEDVEEMCVEDEGEQGEGSVEEVKTSTGPENNDLNEHTEPSTTQEVLMTDSSVMDDASVTAHPKPCSTNMAEGEGQGSEFLQGGDGSVVDGVMQSPQHEHTVTMRSPSEASSPMAVSELAHLSPGSCEQKSPSAVPNTALIHQVSGADKSQQDSCTDQPAPCAEIPGSNDTSCEESSVSSINHNIENITQSISDVEMTMDSVANEEDSSTADTSAPDPSHRSSGQADSGVNVLPLRVEINPVGDSKVYVSANKDINSCSSDTSAQTGTGVVNSLSSSAHSPEESCSTVCSTSESPGNVQRRKRKCKPLHVYCEGKCKAWYGRKAIRAILIAEGHADDLELEKLISKRIADRDTGSNLVNLQFHCTLSPIAKASQAEAEIWFEPAKTVPKEFSVFTTFFKSFFTKLVSKNLLESATV